MNLIRPESEAPVHTRITAKYRFSTKREPSDEKLEDSQSAQEYVSKAMQKNLFGSRLREPIHIPAAHGSSNEQQSNDNQAEEPKPNEQGESYRYFEAANQAEQEQKHQQSQESTDQQSSLEAQILAANQAYDAQTENSQLENPQHPVPVFEKTSTPPVFDNPEASNAYDNAHTVDRQYHTKYIYQPYRGTEDRVRFVEDKLRVSASAEIPRAEIMKQIEKSVIKYMKELEAEGKIITSPQEPKQYYHIVTVPSEEKHSSSSSTAKPRSTTRSYHGTRSSGTQKSPVPYHHSSKQHPKSHYQNDNENRYQASQQQQQHHHHQQQEQSPTQSQTSEVPDQLAPNVEFVYKIKTRAPLQTATVKTVSKPYNLPIKSTVYEKFDHSAALKNMEEFDLSHVVTADEPDDADTNPGKPNKLYFNSEIYHDINSLPFKPEKAIAIAEYRKLKSNDFHPDYKGYAPGYFAEPSVSHSDKDQSVEAQQSDSDEGYPVMNPYKYVLKKEAVPAGLEDHAVANWEQQRVYSSKPLYSVVSGQKGYDYDSYSPKFNNNPEGYGYQHSIKSIISGGEREHSNQKYLRGHTLVKRGKRGNGHVHAHKKGVRSGLKDIEANIALRPPPKI